MVFLLSLQKLQSGRGLHKSPELFPPKMIIFPLVQKESENGTPQELRSRRHGLYAIASDRNGENLGDPRREWNHFHETRGLLMAYRPEDNTYKVSVVVSCQN